VRVLVVGELVAVAEGGAKGAAGIGDATAAERPRRLVEPPVATGEAVFGLARQEVELCFHAFIVPRGCDNSLGPSVHPQ